MSLEVLKCPSCGANVEFKEGVESCECEYCGAKVTKTSTQKKNNSNASKTDFLSTSNTNKLNLENVKSSVDKSVRKGISFVFNAFFIISLLFAGICVIMAISDADVSMIFFGLFCLIYGVMFKILAHTPKGSKYILGKEKGLKPVYFVLICILLSFVMIMLSPTSEEPTDTNNESAIVTEMTTTAD